MGNDIAIKNLFSHKESHIRLFNVSSKEKNDAATWVYKYLLCPIKVAAKLATQPMTPWELYLELHEFCTGRGAAVTTALKHTMNLDRMASCHRGETDRSMMASEYSSLTMPSERLQQALILKLDVTLGQRAIVIAARMPTNRTRPEMNVIMW